MPAEKEGLTIDLSDPGLFNPAFVPIFTDPNRYVLLYGGRDSAKSYTAAQVLVYRLLAERYCKAVLLRKVFADIRESQFQTVLDVIEAWDLGHFFTSTVSPLHVTCELNGNSIIARGLDKAHKLKSIKDPTLVWVEEADEIQLEDFIKSDTSLRSGGRGSLLQMILTFNPEHEEGWIPDMFFPPKSSFERDDGRFHSVKSTRPRTTILHTTYRDNRFMDPQNVELYESLGAVLVQGDNWFRVYCRGLWGNALRGLDFPDVNFVNAFPDRQDCKKFGFGLDFGFTNHPTALVRCALAHGELYFQEETYRTGLFNIRNPRRPGDASIEAEMERAQVGRNDEIIADSAEPKSIQELRSAGFRIQGVPKPGGSLEASLNAMKRYTINVVGSPNGKKELRSYRYPEDRDGNLTNTPIDAWNHFIDAARYWFMKAVGYAQTSRIAMPGME